jgi:hypothetical protein
MTQTSGPQKKLVFEPYLEDLGVLEKIDPLSDLPASWDDIGRSRLVGCFPRRIRKFDIHVMTTAAQKKAEFRHRCFQLHFPARRLDGKRLDASPAPGE